MTAIYKQGKYRSRELNSLIPETGEGSYAENRNAAVVFFFESRWSKKVAKQMATHIQDFCAEWGVSLTDEAALAEAEQATAHRMGAGFSLNDYWGGGGLLLAIFNSSTWSEYRRKYRPTRILIAREK